MFKARNKRKGTLNVNRTPKEKISYLSATVRKFRVYHRYLGLVLGLLLLISSITGILLGWKNEADFLRPPTQQGGTADLSRWASLAELSAIATAALDSAENIALNPIDRVDVRPEKGIVKVLFQQGYWEVQIEGQTGSVLSVARRHSDWIEALHDGSIISDGFKLVSMNILGIGLLVLSVSGFILWFYPRKIRQLKK